MKTELDVHTHTVACGHAYGTVSEMTAAALEKGLRLYGIAEHGPDQQKLISDSFFDNLMVLPRRRNDLELLYGAELNIVDYTGRIYMNRNIYPYLDLRIAGIHSLSYTPGTVAQNTAAYLGAIENREIDVISHPDDDRIKADIETLCYAAWENHTLLELNNNSLRAPGRVHVRENMFRILELCRKLNHPVLLSSDAHCPQDVGNLSLVSELVKEAGFPEELVINSSAERFLAFIAENHPLAYHYER